MGLGFRDFTDADDESAFDLYNENRPSVQQAASVDRKSINDEGVGFFDGSSTAIQRGVKAGVNKVALSLFGSEEDNLRAATENPLQQQLYESAKAKGEIGKDTTLEQYTSNVYNKQKSETLKKIKDNSPTPMDGTGAVVFQALSDYGSRGIIGGGVWGGGYVVGISSRDYEYEKLLSLDVDQQTARTASNILGVTDGVGMIVPVFRAGKGLQGAAVNAGLIAAPVAVMEGGRTVVNQQLNDKGYEHQAVEYKTTKESLLTGLILGGLINRGTAFLHNRNAKNQESQINEGIESEVKSDTVTLDGDAIDNIQVQDDLITSLSDSIRRDFENDIHTHHEGNIEATEKSKQNVNSVEQQIVNKQSINPPHSGVPEPKQKLTASRISTYTSKPWAKAIASEAEKQGINPLDAVIISHIETGGSFDTNIRPVGKGGKLLSSAVGLFQTIENTHNAMGGGNKFDGNNQIKVGLNYYKHNAQIFKKQFDRPPKGLENYFMHFFGEGGGPVFMKAKDSELFVDVASRWSNSQKTGRKITKNHNFNGMTVGEVKTKYQKKWDSVAKKYGGGSGEERVAIAFDERGNAYDTMSDIVDLDDLVVSNDVSGAINALYPQELQPRDRTREASRQQIESIASDLRTELLGNSNRVSDGSPIIGPDNVVESGNGRTLAIQQALSDNRGANYREFVSNYAKDNDINIEGYTNPILVRRRLTSIDRAEFGRFANESGIAQFSASERAIADADRLPDSSLLKLNNDGEINLNQSMEYVRQFMDQVPKAERSNLIDPRGGLSQEGKRRIQSAIVQHAYEDSNLVARLSESIDDSGKNVLNALLRNAPKLSQMSDLVKQGGRHENSIASDLAQAAQKYSDLKESGLEVKDYLKQAQLIDDGLSAGAKEFLNVFDSNSRSVKAISDHIQSKIDEIDNMGDPRQGSLFGNTPEQETALRIMQDNPQMEISAIFEDSSGNLIEVNSVANLFEQIEKDIVLSRQEEIASQAAIGCSLQFG